MKQYLGIETSCDECSASVISKSAERIEVGSVATFSQIQIHQPFGGVVPEISSRNHLETVNAMIDRALSEAGTTMSSISAICVTNRPGLVGSLLVGVSAAKALSYASGVSVVPVHHLEGHAASVFLDTGLEPSRVKYPLLLAIVSGGHTNLYVIRKPFGKWEPDELKRSLVGKSRDDAAGEAFDKTAKQMGFPYPGGIWIDQTSEGGDPRAFDFPRALKGAKELDFSFSGLKTAVALKIKALNSEGQLQRQLPNLCASVQEAIVDALATKFSNAYREFSCQSFALVGGVAANRRLRAELERRFPGRYVPKSQYCTDNAAMIAAAGAFRYEQGQFLTRTQQLTLNAIAAAEV